MNNFADLAAFFSMDDIYCSDLSCMAYSSDAGFYNLTPELVVAPKNEQQIMALFRMARAVSFSVTFRAAGTSLSGQSVTDSVLADIRKHWQKYEIIENGRKIIVRPGVIAGNMNKLLAAYGRKIGPDPASINSCTFGGMLANNSSGMRSGTHSNPFHTVESLRFILPSGYVVDTRNNNADNLFKANEPLIYEGIKQIRADIIEDRELFNLIQKKYRIKNTVGYSLNAFTEFEKPVDILAHLMIGSEGTLGFISEAVCRTVRDFPCRTTGLIIFKNIEDACSIIMPLKKLGAAAIEILDFRCLTTIQDVPGIPDMIRKLKHPAAAIIVEFEEESERSTLETQEKLRSVIDKYRLYSDETPSDFVFITTEASDREKLWKIRRDLLPSISTSREPASTLIVEDIAVNIEDISSAATDLQNLLMKYNYKDAALYGHGIDGNLHFLFGADFKKPDAISNYSAFMDELAELIINKYGGSLKAEHGTGRNMAPYVEKEWGKKAYSLMKKIKQLIDPLNILNPGVVINTDKKVHLRDIKTFPEISEEIDKCIECGFCETFCPSRGYTLSPRQRIILLRKMLYQKELDDYKKDIRNEIKLKLIDTCAADSLCSLYCPLGIDVGAIVKDLRRIYNTKFEVKAANFIKSGFASAELSLKCVSAGAKILSISNPVRKSVNSIIVAAERHIDITLPKIPPRLFMADRIEPNISQEYDFVYFPCCVTRLTGGEEDETVSEVIRDIAGRAGYKLFISKDIHDHCCGMAFASKGFRDQYIYKINELIERFWQWSKSGSIPVFMDSSSCAYTVRKCFADLSPDIQKKFQQIQILDSIEFFDKYITGKLKTLKKCGTVVLHPNCSVRHMGLTDTMIEVAKQYSDNVYVPAHSGCCGFAGDRGMLYPELPKNALYLEMREIKNLKADGYYSSNSPCDMGLSGVSGKEYRHIAYLIKKSV